MTGLAILPKQLHPFQVFQEPLGSSVSKKKKINSGTPVIYALKTSLINQYAEFTHTSGVISLDIDEKKFLTQRERDIYGICNIRNFAPCCIGFRLDAQRLVTEQVLADTHDGMHKKIFGLPVNNGIS